MSERLAALHVLADSTPAYLRHIVDGGLFVTDLQAVGLQPVITTRRSFQSGGTMLMPSHTEQGLSFQEVPARPKELTVIRNHVIPAFKGDVNAPILNSNAVKSFVSSKTRLLPTYTEWQIPTHVLEATTNHKAAQDMVATAARAGDQVVIKPDRGRASQGVVLHSADTAHGFLGEYFALPEAERRAHLIQPFLGRLSLPAGVRGSTTEDTEAIEGLRRRGGPMELRCYTVRDADETTVVPILRAGAGEGTFLGADEVYFDVRLTDELEQKLTTIASTVAGRISAATGVNHLLGAVDVVATDEELRVMDVNFQSPGLRSTKQVGEAGRRIRGALAATMSIMSQGV